MILTEKTKQKSGCCNKPVYVEKWGNARGDYSQRPYCSKCLKIPPLSHEGAEKIRHLLATGQVCDHKFDEWKEDNNFIKLPSCEKWISPIDEPDGVSAEYTAVELYDMYKKQM